MADSCEHMFTSRWTETAVTLLQDCPHVVRLFSAGEDETGPENTAVLSPSLPLLRRPSQQLLRALAASSLCSAFFLTPPGQRELRGKGVHTPPGLSGSLVQRVGEGDRAAATPSPSEWVRPRILIVTSLGELQRGVLCEGGLFLPEPQAPPSPAYSFCPAGVGTSL